MTEPAPLHQPDRDPARDLADEFTRRARAALAAGNQQEALTLLGRANTIGQAVALDEDEAAYRIDALTGARAPGYAHTLEGLPIGHGDEDRDGVTSWQRWARGERPAGLVRTRPKSDQLTADLPPAVAAYLSAHAGHTLEWTIVEDGTEHTITVQVRNRGGDDERPSRKGRTLTPVADSPPAE